MPAWSEQYRAKLRYVDVTQVAALSAFGPAPLLYRLNSPFDPDESGIGQSAAGYNILAGMFRRYRVCGAKVSISFANLGPTTVPVAGSSNQPVWCTYTEFVQSPEVTNPPGGITAVENLYSIDKYAGIGLLKPFSANDQRPIRFDHYVSMKRIYGDRAVDFDQAFQAQVDAVPAIDVQLAISLSPYNFTDATITDRVLIKVKIKYYCHFFERIDPFLTVNT